MPFMDCDQIAQLMAFSCFAVIIKANTHCTVVATYLIPSMHFGLLLCDSALDIHELELK